MNLLEFNTACFDGDIGTLTQYRDMNILPQLYKELDENNNSKFRSLHVANGLFWSVLTAEFKSARFLLENNMVDPNELICGSIHILHVLATLGNLNHTVETKTENGIETESVFIYEKMDLFSQFRNKLIEHIDEDRWFIPLWGSDFGINFCKKEVCEFTTWLLDNYDLNLSVRTKRNICYPVISSHADIWLEYHIEWLDSFSDLTRNFYSCTNFTPFHLACIFGTKEMIQLLVERGCDILCPNCKDICEDCPYYITKLHNYKNSVSSEEYTGSVLDYMFSVDSQNYCWVDEDIDKIKYKDLNSLKKEGYKFQHDAIFEYLNTDVLAILCEELTGYMPSSLQARAIESITESIFDGTFKGNFNMISNRQEQFIHMIFNIKFHKSMIYNGIFHWNGHNKNILCEEELYSILNDDTNENIEYYKRALGKLVLRLISDKRCSSVRMNNIDSICDKIMELEPTKFRLLLNDMYLFHMKCNEIINKI